MALDNAEFIAELSIADPPGTDPLNQGDDHIRTVKKAVQQSFPNVGSAVPQTGAQMAQMAIKNENNVFTLENKFEFVAEFVGTAGRVSNPGPTNDAAILCIDESSVLRWGFGRGSTTNEGGDFVINRFSAAGAFQGTEFRIAPSSGRYTFDKVGFHLGGLDVQDVSGAQQIALSWSDPTNSWSMLSENTGFGGLAASTFRFRRFINGAPTGDVFTVNNSNGEMTFQSSLLARDASITNPSYSFFNQTSLGIFRSANNVMAFVSNGTVRVAVKSNTVFMTLPTGPGGALVSGDLYAKQSQLFAGTELVVGMQP